MGSNLPVPNSHCEVLYRQTYNSAGAIISAGLTQDNRVGNDQKKNNTRLTSSTNKGLLAGSVVAVVGEGQIGACAGDTTTAFDKAVGVVVNDALGNLFESSSAVASGKVVYMHGTGTVFSTDIYETMGVDGTAVLDYDAGDRLFSSQNGLLTKSTGMTNSPSWTWHTEVGIVLKAPSASDPYMTVQMKI
jgi:hypothetical protein